MMLYDLEKVIVTDCDGVLLNWEYAFHVWITRQGYTLKDNSQFSYDVGIRYGLSETEKKFLCKSFNESAAMGFIPPLRDAVHYVQKLHREHGFIFDCVTSMSTDPNANDLRRMNLRKVFGDTVFQNFIFLDTGADKDEVLEKHYKDTGYIWIEDKLENAVAGMKVGMSPIIMEHGHNMIRSHKSQNDPIWQEARNIPRFENWKQIYSHIIGD